MEALINEKRKEIKLRENCRSLMAVESGSRAWGGAATIVYKTTGIQARYVVLFLIPKQSVALPS